MEWFQTPARRLMQLSIRSKVCTCVRKLIDAARSYQSLNDLENDQDVSAVQCISVIDSGKWSHAAGFGPIFENFVKNQELGYFSGKGTDPIILKKNERMKRGTIQLITFNDAFSTVKSDPSNCKFFCLLSPTNNRKKCNEKF